MSSSPDNSRIRRPERCSSLPWFTLREIWGHATWTIRPRRLARASDHLAHEAPVRGHRPRTSSVPCFGLWPRRRRSMTSSSCAASCHRDVQRFVCRRFSTATCVRAYFAILPTIWRATSRSIPGRCVARMIHRRRRRWVRLAGRKDEAVRLPAAWASSTTGRQRRSKSARAELIPSGAATGPRTSPSSAAPAMASEPP